MSNKPKTLLGGDVAWVKDNDELVLWRGDESDDQTRTITARKLPDGFLSNLIHLRKLQALDIITRFLYGGSVSTSINHAIQHFQEKINHQSRKKYKAKPEQVLQCIRNYESQKAMIDFINCKGGDKVQAGKHIDSVTMVFKMFCRICTGKYDKYIVRNKIDSELCAAANQDVQEFGIDRRLKPTCLLLRAIGDSLQHGGCCDYSDPQANAMLKNAFFCQQGRADQGVQHHLNLLLQDSNKAENVAGQLRSLIYLSQITPYKTEMQKSIFEHEKFWWMCIDKALNKCKEDTYCEEIRQQRDELVEIVSHYKKFHTANYTADLSGSPTNSTMPPEEASNTDNEERATHQTRPSRRRSKKCKNNKRKKKKETKDAQSSPTQGNPEESGTDEETNNNVPIKRDGMILLPGELVHTLSEEDLKGDPDECVICSGVYSGELSNSCVAVLPCLHACCMSCLSSQIKSSTKPLCGTCRQEIPPALLPLAVKTICNSTDITERLKRLRVDDGEKEQLCEQIISAANFCMPKIIKSLDSLLTDSLQSRIPYDLTAAQKQKIYEEARKPVDKLTKERDNLLVQLSKRRDPNLLKLLQKQLQRLNQELIPCAQDKAADDIYRLINSAGKMARVNTKKDMIMLDFHGLHWKEAKAKFLDIVQPILPVVKVLTIVVGRGNHSHDGDPKLKNSLSNYIRQKHKNIRCTDDGDNEGALILRWNNKKNKVMK